MKKLSVILAVLLALTMLPALGASAGEDGNMLVNSDFGDTTGWTLAEEGMKYSSSVGHGDTSSLKITENKQEAKQTVDGISREEDYVLRLYSKKDAEVTLAGNVRFYFRDDEGNKITLSDGTDNMLIPGGTDTYTTSTDGWSLYEYTLLGASMPEGTAKLEICLRCQKGNVTNAADGAGFYIDDVWFGKKSSVFVSNLVKNPGFSDVTGEWFDIWNRNASTKAGVGEGFSHGSDGTSGKALHYTGGLDIDNWVQQEVEIEENKDYIFSLWQYTDAASFYGKIQFYFFDANEDNIGSFYNLAICTTVNDQGKTRATANTWTEYRVRLNAAATVDETDAEIPSGTKTVRIMLNAAQKGGSDKNLYLDDVYFGEAASDVVYTVTDAEENTTTISNLTAGTVNVTYNANLPSNYEGDAPSLVPIAALYKKEGNAKRLVNVYVSDAVTLTKGDSTLIALDGFTVPEDDTGAYSIRVFSLYSGARLDYFEKFAPLVPAAPAA